MQAFSELQGRISRYYFYCMVLQFLIESGSFLNFSSELIYFYCNGHVSSNSTPSRIKYSLVERYG